MIPFRFCWFMVEPVAVNGHNPAAVGGSRSSGTAPIGIHSSYVNGTVVSIWGWWSNSGAQNWVD